MTSQPPARSRPVARLSRVREDRAGPVTARELHGEKSASYVLITLTNPGGEHIDTPVEFGKAT